MIELSIGKIKASEIVGVLKGTKVVAVPKQVKKLFRTETIKEYKQVPCLRLVLKNPIYMGNEVVSVLEITKEDMEKIK